MAQAARGKGKTTKKGGRKPRFTKAQMAEALQQCGGVPTDVAKQLGCERKTVYLYLERYPELNEIRAEANDELIDMAESGLRKSVGEGYFPAIRFVLQTKGKNRGYSERVQVVGADDGPIKTEPEKLDLSLYDDDELEQLEALLAKQDASPA